MKIHKSLLWLTLVSFAGCVLLFYFIDRHSDRTDQALNAALGWIGYIAMLTFIVPAVFSAQTRGEWFSKEYGVGTILVLLFNVLAFIGGDYLAYTLAQ